MVEIEENESGPIKKIFKILVVGEMGTGKTSLVRQYVQGEFSEYYKTTIGVDFANKEIEWDSKTSVALQLWDIAGQERFGSMTHVYYQEAVGAFVVFDVMRHHTLDLAKEWKKDIDSKVFTSSDKPIPCILLGNKYDLAPEGKWEKNLEEMRKICEEAGFIGFFETSARTGHNIDIAGKALVQFIIDNNVEPFSEGHGVDLNNPNGKNNDESGCC